MKRLVIITQMVLLSVSSAICFCMEVIDDPHAHNVHIQAVQEQDQRRLDVLLQKVQTGQARQEKETLVRNLVQKGVHHLEDESVAFEQAMHDFTFDPAFSRGESYLFVFDLSGTCLAHGRNRDLIFEDRLNVVDAHNFAYVRKFIDLIKHDGGWTEYEWRNAIKRTYVAPAQVDGKTYVVGAGFYSHASADRVVNLVQSAAERFNYMVHKEGLSSLQAFARISHGKGSLARGDLSLFAVDMSSGQVVAHDAKPHLVGKDAWDYEDARGVFVNKEIAEKLKQTTKGIWQEYMSHKAPKIAYAQLVENAQGNEFFIASAYYPDADEDNVVELVRKTRQHLKSQGPEVTRSVIEDVYNDFLGYGNLTVTVYDPKGTIVASGKNPGRVGTNIAFVRDQDGKRTFSIMKEKAKQGGGWISARIRNAFKSIYVEPVIVGEKTFIISSGIFPSSPEVEIELLVALAVSALKSLSMPRALKLFGDVDTPFIRGDMQVYVITEDGVVLAWGDDDSMIWRDMSNAHDDNGRPFVQMLIEATKAGPAQLSFTINRIDRVTFAKEIELLGKRYIVGSAFFV